MLLILSNSQDVTADYLGQVMVDNRIELLRLDTDTILARGSVGFDAHGPVLVVDGVRYPAERFTSVWYRRPERLKHPEINDSPEGKLVLEEWAEALEGFLAHIDASKWINHPARNVLASHKLEQLSRARSFGLAVPDTLVTQVPEQFREFRARHGGQVIVKPMGSGYVKRRDDEQDSLIYTNRVPAAEHLTNLDDLRACPTLFQQCVQKRSDVRITVIDEHVHAVELTANENGMQRCDIRRNNMEDVSYRRISLPDGIRSRLRSLLASYDLRFAAVDMALDLAGEWFFFEVNPNGQWAWLDLVGATNIANSFVNVVSKGMNR